MQRKVEAMSSETIYKLPESSDTGMNLKETELTLGLPGEPRATKSCMKRVFSETVVDLELGNSGSQKNRDSSANGSLKKKESAISKAQVVGWPPVRAQRKNIMTMKSGKYVKVAQVVGWPPVRAQRKNIMTMKSGKYVKVAMDGAPYLRKVDLEMYNSYEQLLSALEQLFTCLSICNVLNEKKLLDPVGGVEYVPTYEDKDGDWMLVGDVPWKMFAESCKRVRLMTRSEAIGLAPRPETKCSSSSC